MLTWSSEAPGPLPTHRDQTAVEESERLGSGAPGQVKGAAAGDQSRAQGGAHAAQGDCDPRKAHGGSHPSKPLPSSMCAPILDQQGSFPCPLSFWFKDRPYPRPAGPRQAGAH